jgi:hypothetical protein
VDRALPILPSIIIVRAGSNPMSLRLILVVDFERSARPPREGTRRGFGGNEADESSDIFLLSLSSFSRHEAIEEWSMPLQPRYPN